MVAVQWRDAQDTTDRWWCLSGEIAQAPWCHTLDFLDSNGQESNYFVDAEEGYYFFRAVAVDAKAQVTFSDQVLLFYDNSAPSAKLLSISDGLTVKQYAPRREFVFPEGTEVLFFKFEAEDNSASKRPLPVDNSGIGAISCMRVAEDAVQNSDGTFTYTYYVSMLGMPTGPLTFTVYDAVGCNGTDIQAWVTFR